MMRRRCLVGLIGANIQHSLSPALHEDAFAAAGIVGHYHLMDLDLLGARADLARLVDAVRVAGFAGVNVTHPCKEKVLPLLDEIAEEAAAIGAVNTVVIDAAGRARGHNTDCAGFARAFEETLGREAVAGKKAVLVGAGGAGRAVAAALLSLGAARIEVYDKEPSRGASLAAALGPAVRAVPDLGPAFEGAAGVVNATQIGMTGYPGAAVPEALLRPELFVADVVYTPVETELVSAARRRGCRVMTGGGMCVHQAAEAFRLFTGIEPDIGRMHRLFGALSAARDRELAALR
jgi:shikimate dehydrogenase